MASCEGIRFPFPALWNHGVDQLVATLRGMEKFPFASKRALQCAQAEIEEVSR